MYIHLPKHQARPSMLFVHKETVFRKSPLSKLAVLLHDHVVVTCELLDFIAMANPVGFGESTGDFTVESE